MMHNKRGLMAMVVGVSLLLAPGCDEGDDGLNEDVLGEGDEGDGEDERDEQETELTGCALNLTIADCMAELDCAPIYGEALLDDSKGGLCTQAVPEFLGCASTLELCVGDGKTPCEDPCPSYGQTVCEGDSYWRMTSCLPGNLRLCETPGEITGECPPDEFT